MKLHFHRAVVETLLAHSLAATQRAPTCGQMFDGRYRKDGTSIDLDKPGAYAAVQLEDVDQTKIGPGLWLVVDRGVCLMSNGRPNILIAGTEKPVVTYSDEAPKDDPHDVVGAALGFDDGVDFLPAEMIRAGLNLANETWFCIEISPTAIEVVKPADNAAKQAL